MPVHPMAFIRTFVRFATVLLFSLFVSLSSAQAVEASPNLWPHILGCFDLLLHNLPRHRTECGTHLTELPHGFPGTGTFASPPAPTTPSDSTPSCYPCSSAQLPIGGAGFLVADLENDLSYWRPSAPTPDDEILMACCPGPPA
jgi:hypothetical protein